MIHDSIHVKNHYHTYLFIIMVVLWDSRARKICSNEKALNLIARILSTAKRAVMAPPNIPILGKEKMSKTRLQRGR